CYHYYSGRAF
nr:immunoglobulin light chain junction region [Macaca mulatta]MOW39312.1 immunoglobulin light chain junction region [Macaca mulatta]MOW39399.1 immunoglobulin light chain junction region [Macaca mulatta]MOW39541.1 immunoglobulin light chain junction region [Macaca mulatta]MOW39545.1 immunoglobulin light chain junction region [Macaca mulatta]